MNSADVAGFFADSSTIDPTRHVALDYVFECVGDPREAAAHLCSEQSTAQWQRSGVNEDFRPRFAAKVTAFATEPLPGGFSLPLSVRPSGAVHRVRVTIAHPHDNFGPRLPNLLAAVLGEGAFHVPGVPIVRLEDLRFPLQFLEQFEGPQFGLAGIRAQLQAFERPIFLGVVKPNIGLTPAQFAALAEEALLGGLDIAKDDELLADSAHSPLAERAALVGAARLRAEDATGQRKGYMANVTDEVDRMPALHDIAARAGATAVLVNVLPVGLSAVRALRRRAELPIFGHFPMLAALSRVVGFGVHPRVLVRLQRLAGCDAVIMPGFGARMLAGDDEVMACVQACLAPMGPIAPALPVPGGSDSAATLEPLYRKLGHRDFGFVPGRGVFAHPDGPGAGAASVREAWARISDLG